MIEQAAALYYVSFICTLYEGNLENWSKEILVRDWRRAVGGG